jgi:hypothetical protein
MNNRQVFRKCIYCGMRYMGRPNANMHIDVFEWDADGPESIPLLYRDQVFIAPAEHAWARYYIDWSGACRQPTTIRAKKNARGTSTLKPIGPHGRGRSHDRKHRRHHHRIRL